MTRTFFFAAVVACLGACPAPTGQPDGGTGGGTGATGGGSGGSGGSGGGAVQNGAPRVFVLSHNETGSLQRVKAIGLPAKTVAELALPSGAGAPIAVVGSRDGAKVAIIGARDDGMGNIADFSVSLGDVGGTLQKATISSTPTLSFLSDQAAAWYGRAEDLGLWSPDNRRLAVAARYIGPELSRVFVMDANGTNVTEVAPLFASGARGLSRSAFWTADSSALIILRQRNLLPMNFAFDVGAWRPDGGAHFYGQDNARAATEAAVQPGGGDRFAFVQAGQLFLARASEPTATPVTPSTEWVKAIAWSPDGQRLGFITAADAAVASTKQIAIMNADGTNRQPVTFGGSPAEKAFAFSPDSQRLAYLSDEVTPGNTAVFEISGTVPSIATRVQLSGDATPGAVPDAALAWSADSQRVAFGWRSAAQGPMSIKIATRGAAGSAIDGSAVGTVVTSGAKWSPTGHDALAYTSKETSGLMFEHLWMVAGTGGAPVDLGIGKPVLHWWWSRGNVLVGWLQAGNARVVMAVPGATAPQDVVVGSSNDVLVYVDAN